MNENKVKALREKWVAKIMMLNEEYVCARDRLLAAQRLYPALDDVESMLTVCDIQLLAAAIKLSDSKIDNYWVLELLKPSGTYYDVIIHYQKILTLLQPIRDDFPGTDLALQFLQNVFPELSDRENHSDYDFKHDASLAGQKFTSDRNSSGKTLGIVSEDCVSMEVISEKSQNFEPFSLHCHKTEQQDGLTTHQSTHSEDNKISSPLTMAFRKPIQEFYNFENNQKLESIQAGEIWAAHFQANVHGNYRYALINFNGSYELSITWLKPIPISSSEKRWYVAGLPVGCGSFNVNPVTNDDLVLPIVFSHKCTSVHAVTEHQFEIYPKKGEIWALYKNWNLDEWAINPQNLKGCKFDLVELLSDFSKASGADVVCLEKVDGFRSVFQRQMIGQNPIIYQIPSNNLYIFCHKIPAYKLMGRDNDKAVNAIFELDQLALPDDMIHGTSAEIILKEEKLDTSFGLTPMKCLLSWESSTESKFLKDNRSLNYFSIGQVWAVYCGKDKVPRPYVHIDKVISEKQVCVTFLEPLPVFINDIEWKKKNLPIACGLFELSKTSVILKISKFSHPVKHEKSVTEPCFIIYPKKGEVWAVYENWNDEWRQKDYRDNGCYIVEILSDLTNENGITIARLEEVKNNLTFFCRQQYDGSDITCTVSQAKMFSFSHKIPAFKIPGIGMYGIPEDSWHLDPNAFPLKHIR